MNQTENGERLLKEALASTAEPEEHLNQVIIDRYKERTAMKRINRKRVSIGVMAAVFTLLMSVTAFAAVQFFSPKQVAEHLGENILAKAFESGDAIEINESAASGGYYFTLYGIVSGAGLKELSGPEQNVYPDRSYAVVSVARQDGAPMPATSDPDYGKESFFISPLIKGLKPWQINIATMNGGYGEVVLDGIMYRLIECDGIEMFADRGVYMAISSGSPFYDNQAFTYNESTGEISPNKDYDGAAVLFDLPLDKTKADPLKGEEYLRQLPMEPSSTAEEIPVNPSGSEDRAVSDANQESDMIREIEALKAKIPGGTVIPESVQEVTYESNGNIHYEYDGWSVSISPDELFTEGQTGNSDAVQFSGDGTTNWALQFSRDVEGVISGKVIILE
ncbi:hypothetical protein ACE3MQ_01075 [Paenibacillus lentus]|uniref:hypothetical protein n=1 Tax=Paenibacillus lentus TaxID=1338368 RepID=UPI00366615D9